MLELRYARKSNWGKKYRKAPQIVWFGVLFMVGEAGLEPARPQWTLEPESSESTNSTTRPYVVKEERDWWARRDLNPHVRSEH